MSGRLPDRLAAAFVLLAYVCAAGASDAHARDLTETERGELADTVERFDAAMRSKNIPFIIDIVPPRIVRSIASDAKVPMAKLRNGMIETTKLVMESQVLQEFGMDLGGARYLSLANGTPYALVPTTAKIDTGGKSVVVLSDSLALMDGGRWHLLDLGDASRVGVFTKVYPEFAGADLGSKSSKAVP